MLRCLASEHQRTWDVYIPAITHHINSSVHAVTEFAPYLLANSRMPREIWDNHIDNLDNLPKSHKDHFLGLLDIHKEAYKIVQKNDEIMRTKMVAKSDKDASKHYPKVGDAVMVYLNRLQVTDAPKKLKMCKKWLGPYFITEYVTPTTVRLRQVDGGLVLKKPLNIRRLKVVSLRSSYKNLAPPENPPDDESDSISFDELPRHAFTEQQQAAKDRAEPQAPNHSATDQQTAKENKQDRQITDAPTPGESESPEDKAAKALPVTNDQNEIQKFADLFDPFDEESEEPSVKLHNSSNILVQIPISKIIDSAKNENGEIMVKIQTPYGHSSWVKLLDLNDSARAMYEEKSTAPSRTLKYNLRSRLA